MNLTMKPVSRKLPEYQDILRLLRGSFPTQQPMPRLITLQARRRHVDFWAFYDETQFCGLAYVVREGSAALVLHAAARADLREGGYDAAILRTLAEHYPDHLLSMNTPAVDAGAEDCPQRVKRIVQCRQAGFRDTGWLAVQGGEDLLVLAAGEGFDPQAHQRAMDNLWGLSGAQTRPNDRITFRKATPEDADIIQVLYNQIHREEEAGRMLVGWKRGIYPTRQTALDSIAADEMFVEEDGGLVVAAARINHAQEEAYSHARWSCQPPEEQIMVLHTLVVSPQTPHLGYGKRFVEFYESYAREQGCPYLRLDTNQRNLRARGMYRKLGYRETGVVPCIFNGIQGVGLVCLEKNLE